MQASFERYAPPHMTSSRAAWLVVLLLWPVALLNDLDRQMLAVVSVVLVLLIRPGRELERALGGRADGASSGDGP
jgi:hypothetical protein